MLASGDLPEIIIGCNIRLDQLQILANQGLLLPLDDYIEKYGVDSDQVYTAYPQIKDLITMLDGKIYGLPHVNDCYHCSMAQKMWVYQPWLDKLGLEVPTTTEEFYQMLKAFKEQDPNGNGEADEIPLSGTTFTNGGWRSPNRRVPHELVRLQRCGHPQWRTASDPGRWQSQGRFHRRWLARGGALSAQTLQ